MSKIAHADPSASFQNDSTPQDDLSDLPSADTRRWDSKRKAQVVDAVRSGRLTLDQACAIYAMSVDEFLSWQSLFDRYGAKGLMATRLKEFRDERVCEQRSRRQFLPPR